jgi:hypothetical protein
MACVVGWRGIASRLVSGPGEDKKQKIRAVHLILLDRGKYPTKVVALVF